MNTSDRESVRAALKAAPNRAARVRLAADLIDASDEHGASPLGVDLLLQAMGVLTRTNNALNERWRWVQRAAMEAGRSPAPTASEQAEP